MEMVFLIVAIVLVAWFLGFVRSARKAADMANKEMEFQSLQHEVSLLNRTAGLKVTAENAEKAKANIALLDSIRL